MAATWRQVLGYRNGNTRGNVRKKYLDLIRVAHTNKVGGSHDKAVQIIAAWTQAQDYFRLNPAPASTPRPQPSPAAPSPPPRRPASSTARPGPQQPAAASRPPRPTPSPVSMRYAGDWKRVIGFKNGNSKNVARKKAMIAWMANSHKAGARDYFSSAWANAEQYYRFVGDGPSASRQSFTEMDWQPTPSASSRGSAARRVGAHKAGVRKVRKTQHRR